MTDKELLELAAEAAGFKLEQGYGQPPEKCLFYVDSEGRCHDWNPIDDDGDALRLAVKLKINVEHAETLSRNPHGVNCWPLGRGDCGHMETELADYGAATRRAIVRAAAEIGKTLKD